MSSTNTFIQRQKRFLVLLGFSAPLVGAVLLLEGTSLQRFGLSSPRPIQYVLLAIIVLLFVLAKKQLKCPFCLHSVWPLDARNCPHCGKALSNSTLQAPKSLATNPSTVIEEVSLDLSSLRRLDRYLRFMLFFWIPVAFIFGAAFLFFPGEWSISGSVFTSVFIYGLGWFFTIYLPERFLEAVLWLRIAKCPKCKVRFAAEVAGAIPGHIILKRTIPQFCSACGVKIKCVG